MRFLVCALALLAAASYGLTTTASIQQLAKYKYLERLSRAELKSTLDRMDRRTLKEALENIDGPTLKEGIQVLKELGKCRLKQAVEDLDRPTLKEALQRIDEATLQVTMEVIDEPTYRVGLEEVDEATKRYMRKHRTTPTSDCEPVVAKSIGAELYMRQLCCDDTVEDQGADEVYILVFGRRTDGATFAARIPGEKQHWDMNDGNQPTDNPSGDSHCITGKSLFSGDLAPGQSWNLSVTVMEEDGGTTKTAQQVVGALLIETGDPYAAAAGTIIGGLAKLGVFITDTDDWPGSIGVRISNNNGSLRTEWRSKERIVDSIPDPDDKGNPNKREFRMNGDGSNYVAWFGVR